MAPLSAEENRLILKHNVIETVNCLSNGLIASALGDQRELLDGGAGSFKIIVSPRIKRTKGGPETAARFRAVVQVNNTGKGFRVGGTRGTRVYILTCGGKLMQLRGGKPS